MALGMQGDFGGNLAAGKVVKTENPTTLSKMGKSKAIISGMGDSIRNSLLRAANTISGCPGDKAILNIARNWEIVSFRGRFWKYAKRAR